MVVWAHARAPIFLIGMRLVAPLSFLRVFPRLRSRSRAGVPLACLTMIVGEPAAAG